MEHIEEEKVRQAWNRAEGKCENYDRHGAPKRLEWDNRGREDEDGWNASLIDEQDSIIPANLRILCWPCTQRVRKPY